MLDKAIKILQQRQQTVNAQLKRLQAEAGKLEEALRVVEKLSAAVTEKAPPARKRASVAGRQTVSAAAKARWASILTPKETETETKAPLPPERDHHRVPSEADKGEQKKHALVPASQMIPCTCGGINTTCMYCAGTGMREPS